MSIFEKKSEEKPSVQTAQIIPEKVQQQTVILSKDDAYISEIMKSQPKTLDDLEVSVTERDNPNEHRLTLPSEIKKYEDRYVFRWIYKTQRGISEATQLKKWTLVNKTYFTDLPNHFFSSNGAIERGDNILAFIPRKIAEAMRLKASSASIQAVKSKLGAHKDNPNFYVPTETEDGKKTKVVGL